MLFNISCFYYYFLLVSGPAVIGHSCCGVPANVLSVCLFVCLFVVFLAMLILVLKNRFHAYVVSVYRNS